MNVKIKFLTVLVFILAMNLNAQNSERKWGLGLNFGNEQYNGDFGNGFFNFDQAWYGFVGVSIGRNITEHLDLTLNSSLGEIGFVENDANRFRHSLFQANLNAQYNFFKYDEVKLRPFLHAGVGYMNFSDMRSDRKFSNMALPSLGAGITYKVSDAVSLVLRETFLFSDYDNIEYEKGDENDFYLQNTLGIVFNLGKSKDSDGDGISDKKDNCPNVPGMLEFMGCPDSDGDGIADKDDPCPKTKGLKEFSGCPDSDGDGIADGDDSCPNKAGTKEFNGCPDTDGDGIADAEDTCPNEKGSAEMNGCPDSDGDGVADNVDSCPSVMGLPALKGCPDSDGDGVANGMDACPDVAGLAKNKGCPDVKKEDKEVLAQALHGVKFKTGSDVITTSSYAVLNNVVNIMKSNAAYNLSINGHTDSQGNDENNLDLSKRRANAVKAYLVKQGVAASRLTAKGFGETKPVADNGTSKGRAENRRVELSIDF